MIQFEDVSVSFSKRAPLLHDVNLTLRRGETFVVIGSSGVGKSVLLKTAAGLIAPEKGRVLIDGESLYQVSRRQQAVLMYKMGMLFQKNALFDSLTVRDNLAFPLREVSKLPEDKIQEKVMEFLGYVGLSHAADLMPSEISGGMQKRVGVARALILNPKMILYDDPTAGLDPITSRLIIDLIIKLNREFGTTVMAITNEMNRAYQLGGEKGRMGMILDGTLLVTGTVEETKNHPDKRVQDFINGRYKEGVIDFQHSHEVSWL
jgi:phospholipid/cholesterol/gamma-HCH transport system ATP-binding protein